MVSSFMRRPPSELDRIILLLLVCENSHADRRAPHSLRCKKISQPSTLKGAKSDCGRSGLQLALFPNRSDRRPHQERRVRAFPGDKLLCAAAIYLSHVQIPFLVHVEPVDAPHPTRKISPGSPRVLE